MEIIWEDPPGTTQDVIKALRDDEDWKPQTIKTLLARLVKKGVLKTESQGNRYLYHPEVSREDAIAVETESFLKRICKDSLEPMLTYFANAERPLDEDEIAALKRILENEKPTDKKRRTKK